jgi:S1-C subfamily serine protease
MKKITLYSSSGGARRSGGTAARDAAATADAVPGSRAPEGAIPAPSAAGADAAPLPRARAWLARHERAVLVAAGAAVALAVVGGYSAMSPKPQRLTQQDIDAAVLHTLENNALPSPAAKAYEAVRRSVVRVRGFGFPKAADAPAAGSKAADPNDKAGKDRGAKDRDAKAKNPRTGKAGKDGKEEADDGGSEGVGSGVVIIDNGTILTNLHVVWHAERIVVEFADGMESPATVIAVRPEHDLAVLKAEKIPDDLPAATLRPTADLKPGDEVVAVGFPFGIGPSVSAGVVSGMRREHRSPEGKRILTNLIQFDAAANPGNSGGPLVTRDGEVVGIVTGILNPTEQRVFIGIGFAVPIENAAAAVGIPPI